MSVVCPHCGETITVERSPWRTSILAALLAADEPMSPVMLSRQIAGLSIPLAAYHVRVLCQRGDVELVSTRPRRGATEHLYRLANPTRRTAA